MTQQAQSKLNELKKQRKTLMTLNTILRSKRVNARINALELAIVGFRTIPGGF